MLVFDPSCKAVRIFILQKQNRPTARRHTPSCVIGSVPFIAMVLFWLPDVFQIKLLNYLVESLCDYSILSAGCSKNLSASLNLPLGKRCNCGGTNIVIKMLNLSDPWDHCAYAGSIQYESQGCLCR